MILGQSGTGKSTSLRNMDPAQTLLIQVIAKPLPFRSKEWKLVKDGGNIIVSADSAQIVAAMQKTTRPIIVIDDFQYLLVTEFMARAHETGYTKFSEMARHYWDVLKMASELAQHKRVYMLSHTETNEAGQTQAKLIGKMLAEKIVVEGMVTIVLGTHVINGQHVFSTKNSGSNTVKVPIDLVPDDAEHIPNDLSAFDQFVVAYYGLETKAA